MSGLLPGFYRLLLLTGLLWGCTNPFIRRGTRGLRAVREDSWPKQARAELYFLLGNWRYVVPWLVNQLGSLSYLAAVQRAPLSLAVPAANGLAFAATALTGAVTKLEEPLDRASPILRPSDWFPEFPDDESAELAHDQPNLDQSNDENRGNSTDQLSAPAGSKPNEAEPDAQCPPTTSQVAASSASNCAAAIAGTSTANKDTGEDTVVLDDDILQILGDEPSSATKYGKDIRTEIASRLTHTVKEGLTKEIRKDLISKYPIPANCVHIGAPRLNPEIKAAMSENFVKRDKGIESKQTEMASAISCLGEIITLQLNSKEKNNILLQRLIDLSRILCDLQFADSVTRRNFILFTLKKELKDHLVNTKIDSCLFGESLSETLKTAKAVMKSGVAIKAAAPKQAPAQQGKLKSVASRPLNRRGPAPRRPPPGPPPPAPAPRSRAPARRAPPPPAPAPAPPARYYKPSYTHQPPQRRY